MFCSNKMLCIKKCRDDFMYKYIIIILLTLYFYSQSIMLKIENNDPYHCKYLKIGNYVIQQLRDSYKLAGRHKGVSKN